MVFLVLFAGGSAIADSQVSASDSLHNGDELLRTATDLSFSVHVPESEKEGYWIKSYTITTSPDVGGSYSVTEHTNTGGHIWKVDVRYDDISVPFCDTIRIDVEATLNKWNHLYISDMEWSYESDPENVIKAMPDHGFFFELVPEYGESAHNTFYAFVNIDPSVPININELSFYHSSIWVGPAGQWDSVLLFDPIIDDFLPQTVYPGETLFVNLSEIPNIAESYIYVVGQMEYDMPGFAFETVNFMNGHEESTRQVPSLTGWGLLILVVLLIGSGIWLYMQRRKRAVAS
jgi:hypothetical protein